MIIVCFIALLLLACAYEAVEDRLPRAQVAERKAIDWTER